MIRLGWVKEFMPAAFTALAPMLIVERVEPTRTFFCDRLGFKATLDMQHDGRIGFSIVERGAVRIMLQSEASLRADMGETPVAGPFGAWLYIDVDNVEELVPEIVDTDVVVALRRTSYGRHEIGVREPGGNVIVFASRSPD